MLLVEELKIAAITRRTGARDSVVTRKEDLEIAAA